MVSNYNPSLDKQNGEAELKRTSNYEAYKANTENPVKRLSYWKSLKQDFEKMMVNDILPLQRR
jgi:type I restriction enzyme R subunit